MIVPSSLALAVGLFLVGGSASSVARVRKRWDTTLCPDYPGVPVPDSANFQLPLENLRQDMCWDFCIGDQSACTIKSKICYDFVGTNLVFDYQPVPGHVYTEADIWLGLSPASGTPVPQFTTSNPSCTIAADGSTVHCTIPYDKITSNPDVLSGMCPNGDREGLVLYLHTNAKLTGPNGVVHGSGRLSCTDWPTCSSYHPFTYWVLTYRCSKCPDSPPPPPPPQSCPFGTAFGYTESPRSSTLRSYKPLPKTCDRWGWYTTPTLAQLQTSISGRLYVGAGQNDISGSTQVGYWSAVASPSGLVTVTYYLSTVYRLADVHVDIGCLPFEKCSPGQYKYVNDDPTTMTFTTPGLQFPTCLNGGEVYLIVHASIDKEGC